RHHLTPRSPLFPYPTLFRSEVVRHRLAEIGAAVEQGHERPSTREPDRGLAGRISSDDDGDTRCPAQLLLRRARRIEDAQALVVGEALVRKSAVLGACREELR